MIKQLKFIMNQKEKRQLPLLLVEIVIGALLETIGVSAILPVINILIEPESINGDGYIAQIYRIGKFGDLRSFETTLFIAIIVFYVLKNIYLTAMRFHQNYFINVGQRTLTNRLMNGYFRQSYSYFTKKYRRFAKKCFKRCRQMLSDGAGNANNCDARVCCYCVIIVFANFRLDDYRSNDGNGRCCDAYFLKNNE